MIIMALTMCWCFILYNFIGVRGSKFLWFFYYVIYNIFFIFVDCIFMFLWDVVSLYGWLKGKLMVIMKIIFQIVPVLFYCLMFCPYDDTSGAFLFAVIPFVIPKFLALKM